MSPSVSQGALETAREIARATRAGERSALDTWEEHRRRALAAEGTVHAFVDLEAFAEEGRRRADAVDRRLGQPLDRPVDLPLAGVPVAIKDNLAYAGQALGCGSRILDGYVAPTHATAVARLLDAGAVPVGKTRLDEFAMGSSGESAKEGATRNPWNAERVPGGSSSGSSAAVATAVPVALGSDTGGSVRQPAAFCGVVGLRPTRGRVSRRGLVGFAPSFDQVGPVGRTVADVALVFETIAGHDPGDATSSDREVAKVELGSDRTLSGVRVGVPRELDVDSLPRDVARDFRTAIERLETLGAAIIDVSIPDLDAAVACYHLLAAAEASTTLARFDGVRFGIREGRREAGETLEDLHARTRGRGFGPEVQRRILLGTFALSAGQAEAYAHHARKVRRTLCRRIETALAAVDILATPTAPSAAFRIGEKVDDPLGLYASDAFTTPASLAGLPAISVPSGLDADGLPLGLHLVGRAFDEETILRVAHAFESSTDFPACPLRRTIERRGIESREAA